MTTAAIVGAYGNTLAGDVDKSVQSMINSVEISPAPLRLALGGDAYRDMRASLVSRLEALDA